MLSSIESPPAHDVAAPKSIMAKNGETDCPSSGQDGADGQGGDGAIAMPSGENNSSSSNNDRTPLHNNSFKKKCVTFAEDVNKPKKKTIGDVYIFYYFLWFLRFATYLLKSVIDDSQKLNTKIIKLILETLYLIFSHFFTYKQIIWREIKGLF